MNFLLNNFPSSYEIFLKTRLTIWKIKKGSVVRGDFGFFSCAKISLVIDSKLKRLIVSPEIISDMASAEA
jgi:hypothetical protein